MTSHVPNIAPTSEAFDAFISYCHSDRSWVREWLVPRLRKSGLAICVDYDSFPPGEPIVRAIERAVQNSRKTLLILSPDYLKSEWCEFENILVQTQSHGADSQKMIPIMHQRCEDVQIPPRIRSLLWVDMEQSDEIEFQLKRLIAAILGEPLPQWPCKTIGINEVHRNTQEHASSLSEMFHIAPLGIDLSSVNPPQYLSIPSCYSYLGKLDNLPIEHLYRKQDKHIAVWIPARPGVSRSFLMDKYAITSQQFSIFLNDLAEQGQLQLKYQSKNQVKYCMDIWGHKLAFDALNQWHLGLTENHPWLHGTKPWGITYQDGAWIPILGSELLPATLVTWWGSVLYSLWAHRQSLFPSNESCKFLPTLDHWRIAALWDFAAQRYRNYPWGDTWMREWVNYAGYWIGRDVTEVEWEKKWANQADVYGKTRPLPVASLNDGQSPTGCVQMVGNVWEWCADNPEACETTKAVKGGACISPREHCDPVRLRAWRPEHSSEYIGFRCCFLMP